MTLLYRLNVYAFLVNDQELGVSENMERMNKFEDLETKYSNATAFFSSELLELSKEEYDKLFENDKLKEYNIADVMARGVKGTYIKFNNINNIITLVDNF